MYISEYLLHYMLTQMPKELHRSAVALHYEQQVKLNANNKNTIIQLVMDSFSIIVRFNTFYWCSVTMF